MSRWSGCPRPSLHGPQPGELWRHFKGDLYLVLHVASDSEWSNGRHESRVLYQLADDPESKVWDRPRHMWEEEVELHAYHSAELDQGVQKPTTRRFLLEAEATVERRIDAVQRFLIHDLQQMFERQFIGRSKSPEDQQELADSNAKAMFGPEATGRFEQDPDNPTILTWHVSFPLMQVT